MSTSELPPSPPLTEDCSVASPAIAALAQLAPDSPPTSPKQSASPVILTQPILALGAPPAAAATASSPLAPLSRELFLLVLSFLPQHERPPLGLVSRAWHNFIVNEPTLWPHLAVTLSADQDKFLETWINRAHGVGNVAPPVVGGAPATTGVRSVRIWLPHHSTRTVQYADSITELQLGQRMSRLLQKLRDAHDGNPNSAGVESIELFAQPSTKLTIKLCNWLTSTVPTISCFARLKEVVMNVYVANPQLSRLFLSAWAELERSCLTFHGTQFPGINDGSSVGFGLITPKQSIASLDYLRSISWTGVMVPPAMSIPRLPVLTSLTLHNVEWEGKSLLLLIRLARKTLEHIDIRDLALRSIEGEEDWEDWSNYVNVSEPELLDGWLPPPRAAINSRSSRSDSSESFSDDEDEDEADSSDDVPEPPPICLPALRSLVLKGVDTPALFASSGPIEYFDWDEALPCATWVMPNLVSCELDRIELDSVLAESAKNALDTLADSTQSLESFCLAGSTASTIELWKFLVKRGSTLRSLQLYDSGTAINDILVARLAELTPRLQHLDVRCCSDVSVVAVARVVEAIRDRSNGYERITRVEVDTPGYYDYADWRAWHWLDYHGILVRDEDDLEGNGPQDSETKRKWIKMGKSDSDLQGRLFREKQLREQKERDDNSRREQQDRIALRDALRERVERGDVPPSSQVNYGPVMPWPQAIHQKDRPAQPKPSQRRKVSAQEQRQAEFEQRVQADEERMIANMYAFRDDEQDELDVERGRSSSPVVEINLSDDDQKPLAGRKRSSSSMSDGEDAMSISPAESA